MRQLINRIFNPVFNSADPVEGWKLATFHKTLLYGFIPLTIPIILGFSFFSIWQMTIAACGLFFVFVFSLWLVCKNHLVFSVNLSITGTTFTNFFYLFAFNNSDGLPFTTFMIIIVGLFLGTRYAFIWGFIQISLLIISALLLTDYGIIPSFSTLINHNNITHTVPQSFLPVIFLCFVSACISIVFKHFFVDLVKKVEKSKNEKILLETELFQAQKMETIGLLTSGIAHDFNCWLSRIQSCSNLILKRFSKLDIELARLAQTIYESCGVISGSTGKLLGFARKAGTEMVNINIHEVIESMVNLFKYMLDTNIEIQTNMQALHCTIYGNFSQLQSVLMNLAINANDAMPKGGILSITTDNALFDPDSGSETTSDNNTDNFLVLKFSDSGCGIDNSIKDKIFTPFFTTKSSDKGTGLGLSIINRIMTAHNGVINLTSELGKGSTFSLYFPLAKKPGNNGSMKLM